MRAEENHAVLLLIVMALRSRHAQRVESPGMGSPGPQKAQELQKCFLLGLHTGVATCMSGKSLYRKGRTNETTWQKPSAEGERRDADTSKRWQSVKESFDLCEPYLYCSRDHLIFEESRVFSPSSPLFPACRAMILLVCLRPGVLILGKAYSFTYAEVVIHYSFWGRGSQVGILLQRALNKQD